MVGALSIKLRCASWQQLATIYRRDISQGTMFLKASTPPAIGTEVKIDLTLPSDTVIAMTGVVDHHVTDPVRGSGVELKLAPLAESAVWLIESALAAESKVRAQWTPGSNSGVPGTNSGIPGAIGKQPSGAVRLATPALGVPIMVGKQASGPVHSLTDGEEVASAEQELIAALGSEVESLKKLNPFLVLGVGYEAADADVRAAFGELTKRYHPDRFARYQSPELRQTAAEIFILIRDAYRKIGDTAGRGQVLQALGRSPAPRAVAAPRQVSQAILRPAVKPPKPTTDDHERATVVPTRPPEGERETVVPARPGTRPPPIPARPTPPPVVSRTPSRPMPRISVEPPPPPANYQTPSKAMPRITPDRLAAQATVPIATIEPVVDSATTLEQLLDAGKFDEALIQFKMLAKKHPQDRTFRAGTELCEGLRALAARDRLEAAQRFESALEIDPSNERAARELADMRRQATNERKGLLSRLMGKKE